MSETTDYTEHQTPTERERAQRLSLQRTQPPGEATGYEVQQFLGAGAYGEVWVGTDRTTGRRVAIKFYTHRGGLDWPLLSREVEKLVFLSADRYVVQLLDVGWTAEPPYYVMEYLERGSLYDLLVREGTLPVEEAVDLFRDVAVGLTHAHAKGVLHCDLKPANILLDQDDRPRLADFGQSRLSHEQTPALGTLFFMAPEQANLEAVPDARWDVYALGAILYRMLTGDLPYRDTAAVDAIDSTADLPERLQCYREHIQRSSSPAAHRNRAGIDSALVEIIDNCLAVDPKQRYSNAQAVLDALAARQQRRLRRPLMLLGVAGPVLLLVIMMAFYARGFSRALRQSEQSINQQVYRGNEFAAKFVAKSFEAEIADYFQIVENEIARDEFARLLEQTLAIETLDQLNDPTRQAEPPPDVLERFLQAAQRQPFKHYLARRLEHYDRDATTTSTPFASLFVVDRWGTIVAAAYREQITTQSVGRNFCWRNYFHGGPEDLPKFFPTEPPPHIEATHLSAAFKSTTTGKWKVAITTPIYRSPEREQEFLGVLAMTVNVGDFAIFRGDRTGTDYFAVLVDDRPGEQRGTILQHPLFETQPPTVDYRLTAEQLASVRTRRDFTYRDPLAAAPGGQEFAGQWIAATEPVHLPTRSRYASTANASTDLLVMVQVSAAKATAPVKQLGRRLAIDGAIALSFVVLVVAVLWLIVFRLFGDADRLRTVRGKTGSASVGDSHRSSLTIRADR